MGSADNQGVLQCIREIVTNSIDEATMGFGKKITIELFSNNRVRCSDEARGCPFGIREDGTEALEAIYTMAHSGGKFNNKVYQNVTGLNGIGAKGTALSSDICDIWSYRNGECAHLHLDKGVKSSFDITQTSHIDGTVVEFIPSQEVYNLEPIEINFDELKKMCKNWSYLSKGISFILINQITNEKIIYCSNNGLIDLINTKDLINKPIYINLNENNIDAEIVMGWTKNRNEEWHIFTNGFENIEGGTPNTGIKTSLTNFFKKRIKLDGNTDIYRRGLYYAVAIKIPNPSFANQTKTKVNNPELRGLCQRATTQMLELFEQSQKEDYNKYRLEMDLFYSL